jgi:phage portal protein BeeE
MAGSRSSVATLDGKVLELMPVMPATSASIQDADYSVVYEVSDANGMIARLPGGRSREGSRLRCCIFVARVGTGSRASRFQTGTRRDRPEIAAEESLARLSQQRGAAERLLTHRQQARQAGSSTGSRAFQDAYAGLQNAFKTIVLDAGMKYTQMSLTPVDTQALESRKHQIEEICRRSACSRK